MVCEGSYINIGGLPDDFLIKLVKVDELKNGHYIGLRFGKLRGFYERSSTKM